MPQHSPPGTWRERSGLCWRRATGADIDAIYRCDSRRVFATAVRLLGSLDLAEEAWHDAFLAAAEQQPVQGVRERPAKHRGPFDYLVSTQPRAKPFPLWLENAVNKLTPYLGCDGNCAEAMRFYEQALEFPDVARGEAAFNALAEGGTITMPMAPSFWSKQFGMVADRFGVGWTVNAGQARM